MCWLLAPKHCKSCASRGYMIIYAENKVYFFFQQRLVDLRHFKVNYGPFQSTQESHKEAPHVQQILFLLKEKSLLVPVPTSHPLRAGVCKGKSSVKQACSAVAVLHWIKVLSSQGNDATGNCLLQF